MPLACIYHKKEGMQVVSLDERERLVALGEWVRHPNDLKEQNLKENEHEEPIRQQPKQRRSHAKQPSEKI